MSSSMILLTVAAMGQVFLFVLFAALDHQRHRIGGAAPAMAFCATLLFGCMATAAGLRLSLPWGGSVDYSRTIVHLPLLTAFLMVFIIRGVLDSQRLLIGALASYLLFIYFSMLIRLQCASLPESPLRGVLYTMLGEVSGAVNFNAVSDLIACLTVPMFYALGSRLRFRFFRILFALTGAQLVATIPELILMRIGGRAVFSWPAALASGVSILALSLMLAAYLRLLGQDVPDGRTGVFDFIFAFFGSYGRVRELEEDLSGWENRYRMVLRHTAEVVIMSDAKGIVTEANIAAGRLFGGDALIGRDLFSLFVPETPVTAVEAADHPVYFNCAVGRDGGGATLSASVSPVRIKKRLLLVMVARDTTAERKLAAEKAALADQLVHAQRMESLGVLAGGIAHDFNNYIHAILGHADVALMLGLNDTDKTASHLRKITAIAEKAGKLTAQLLGFARQGRYNVVNLEARELLEECSALLDPGRMRGVSVRSSYPDRAVMRGDLLQMQQMIMNLLINALDAMENNADGKILTLSAGTAARAPLTFSPPPDREGAKAEDFIYIVIGDNGAGMDEATLGKIFEPFFTTKPIGQGTGMGLAMVYGTVTHHKGWIQVKSAPGAGTTFCIFLPRSVEA